MIECYAIFMIYCYCSSQLSTISVTDITIRVIARTADNHIQIKVKQENQLLEVTLAIDNSDNVRWSGRDTNVSREWGNPYTTLNLVRPFLTKIPVKSLF